MRGYNYCYIYKKPIRNEILPHFLQDYLHAKCFFHNDIKSFTDGNKMIVTFLVYGVFEQVYMQSCILHFNLFVLLSKAGFVTK